MYRKVIQSGDLVELWEYERAPNPVPYSQRKPRIKRVFNRKRRLDNVVKLKNSFRRLVRANLLLGAPALVTLNTRENMGVEEGYKNLTKFGVRLRKQFGSSVAWISVPEFQKRGAIHFHCLVWNLPEGLPCLLSLQWYTDKVGKKHRKHVCPIERACERQTRRIASCWTAGFVDAIETDGNVRISSYLAKYMSKAMHDERLLGKRAYSASRNVLRPVSLNTSFQIAEAFSVWGITVDNPVVQQKEYDTLHLGRCNYKSMLLNQNEDSESPIDAS